ncbi:hypothetical protein ElyMa_005085400 [Elysia marginata]|uniref:Uncharacterized protein n=1 Tax=Elysia marginata TaxID=1093978 RepID=A0AAV4JGX9_9GAST|nr:hypothetical protein ElyMa_005085400 [Elysia marginata]
MDALNVASYDISYRVIKNTGLNPTREIWRLQINNRSWETPFSTAERPNTQTLASKRRCRNQRARDSNCITARVSQKVATNAVDCCLLKHQFTIPILLQCPN